MNDRLALGRVIRDASLKRQRLGQEMNKEMSESLKDLEGESCRQREPQIPGFRCENDSGLSLSMNTNEVEQSK